MFGLLDWVPVADLQSHGSSGIYRLEASRSMRIRACDSTTRRRSNWGQLPCPFSNQTPSACACEVGNCEMLASPLAYLSRGI